ncbi:hypothetical protein Tco_0403523 [Tanacetum coccineum]
MGRRLLCPPPGPALLGIPETDKKRLGNGIGNVSNIRETFRGRIGGVSVPTAFPNGYGSPTGVSVLQRVLVLVSITTEFDSAAVRVSICSTTQALWKLSCLLEAAHKSLVSIRLGLRSQGCLHARSTSCGPSVCAIRTSYTLVLTSCADYCSLPPMQTAAPYLLCRPLLLTSCADCCSLPPVQTVVPYLLRRLLLLTSR